MEQCEGKCQAVGRRFPEELGGEATQTSYARRNAEFAYSCFKWCVTREMNADCLQGREEWEGSAVNGRNSPPATDS